MQKGDYPNFKVTGKDLPFSDADVGKRFEFTGKVKLDTLTPEGPTFVFEVLEINFPEKETGTIGSRKRKRNIAGAGVKITIETGD